MKKRLIMAIVSLAILIGIIMSIFSFNKEEKVYTEGVLVYRSDYVEDVVL